MYLAGATFCFVVVVATFVWFLMRVAGTSVDKPLYVSRRHARELAEADAAEGQTFLRAWTEVRDDK